MRIGTFVCLLALSACATVSPPPERGYYDTFEGRYDFDGVAEGNPDVSVFGTVTLGEGQYRLDGSHGSCEGRLPLTPSTGLSIRCGDMSVGLRFLARAIESNATASVRVQELVSRKVCEWVLDSNGKRICIPRIVNEWVMVTRRARVTVERVVDDVEPFPER